MFFFKGAFFGSLCAAPPMRLTALSALALAGLVHGIPVAKDATLSSLQTESVCHASEMQDSCPGYAKVMRFCCEQADGRGEHDETCDNYAKQDKICGGNSGMMRAMSSCCALEWGCKGGYCGSPDEPKVTATHAHVGKKAPAVAPAQEAQRKLAASAADDAVLGDQQENIEVWTDGTKEGIDDGSAAAAQKAIDAAPKFEFGTSDLDPDLTGCVSIQAAVNDFWCTTTCAGGGHCPKQLCKCGEEVKCKKDEKTKEVLCSLKDSAAEKVRAARDTPEPEADWVAEPEAPKRVRPSCVAIAPSVTDYWCMDTCVSLLSGLVHGGCPKNACSCGKDAKEAQANAEASKNAKPIVKQRARHEGEVGFDPVKKAACNLDVSAEGCTTDEIMQQLEDRQTAAPSWDDAHPAEKRQKSPPNWNDAFPAGGKGADAARGNGAPTWDEALGKGAPTWEDAHKNGEPTWDAAHPTVAQKGADKAALVCVSLDISVSPDWCKTTCSAGGCPKVCACGTQKDLDSGKLDAQLHPEVPAPTTNKAVIQHALACISLIPSVDDAWCLSTCAAGDSSECEEAWCVEERKSCKATCRCGVAENLVKPGAPAIWEKVEEVPKPKCKRYATQGSNPQTSRPQAGLPLTRLSLYSHVALPWTACRRA